MVIIKLLDYQPKSFFLKRFGKRIAPRLFLIDLNKGSLKLILNRLNIKGIEYELIEDVQFLYEFV